MNDVAFVGDPRSAVMEISQFCVLTGDRNPKHVYAMIQAGTLPKPLRVVRFGRRLFITKASVQAFLDGESDDDE